MDEEIKEDKLSSKQNTLKKILQIVLLTFLIGNIGMYLSQRDKWLYKGQPYPKAKEWLIPANIMLVYGTTITKLPFVDERSFIMKPIIYLQDYFVKKWQENLPDDDAEKYLGWYFFKLSSYVVQNTRSNVLYGHGIYSAQETRQMLDKLWMTIEKMATLKAKDKEFEEMRYAAFMNSALTYVESIMGYWIEEKNNKPYTDRKDIAISWTKKLNDKEKLKNFIKLLIWIEQKNEYYEKNYPNMSNINETRLFKSMLIYKTTRYILNTYNDTFEYKNIKDYCNPNKNNILQKYLNSRNTIKLLNNTLIANKNSDKNLNKICPNINIKKELSNGYNNN